jgi:hypothetical protein
MATTGAPVFTHEVQTSTDPLDVGVDWRIRSVVVNNQTPQWLLLPTIGQYVPPWRTGVRLNYGLASSSRFVLRFESPPGVAQPSPQLGQLVIVTLSSESTSPSPGIELQLGVGGTTGLFIVDEFLFPSTQNFVSRTINLPGWARGLALIMNAFEFLSVNISQNLPDGSTLTVFSLNSELQQQLPFFPPVFLPLTSILVNPGDVISLNYSVQRLAVTSSPSDITIFVFATKDPIPSEALSFSQVSPMATQLVPDWQTLTLTPFDLTLAPGAVGAVPPFSDQPIFNHRLRSLNYVVSVVSTSAAGTSLLTVSTNYSRLIDKVRVATPATTSALWPPLSRTVSLEHPAGNFILTPNFSKQAVFFQNDSASVATLAVSGTLVATFP